MNLTIELLKQLQNLCSESGDERGGYITSDYKMYEVKNNHPEKSNNFMFSCEDLEKLEDDNVIATFHTHPNKTSNLSKEDYEAFLNWEKLLHFIIGKDRISCYKVSDRGTVLVEPVNVLEKPNVG